MNDDRDFPKYHSLPGTYSGYELSEGATHQVELDPNGKSPHVPGSKLDSGKPMVESILGQFSRALLEVSRVGTFGAKKYTLNGWQEVPDGVRRYSDASGRHRMYEGIGEEVDPDSGLLHKAHRVWNELAALELYLREKENAVTD